PSAARSSWMHCTSESSVTETDFQTELKIASLLTIWFGVLASTARTSNVCGRNRISSEPRRSRRRSGSSVSPWNNRTFRGFSSKFRLRPLDRSCFGFTSYSGEVVPTQGATCPEVRHDGHVHSYPGGGRARGSTGSRRRRHGLEPDRHPGDRRTAQRNAPGAGPRRDARGDVRRAPS